MFRAAPFRWWVSGGHALELWVGEAWRAHEDLDIGLCRHDLDPALTWLDGWDFGMGANNVWARRVSDGPWELDLTVGAGKDQWWVYRRHPSLSRPWGEAVLTTGDGVPYLAPELQLLFKSKQVRPKDQVDAERVIPELDAGRRELLDEWLPVGHPWKGLLD